MCLQCRRPGFDPWVGKIPWRRKWLLTPVFWPGEFHRLYSPWDCKELDTTEWLSLSHTYICICVYIYIYQTHMYIHMNLNLINEAVQNTRNTVEMETVWTWGLENWLSGPHSASSCVICGKSLHFSGLQFCNLLSLQWKEAFRLYIMFLHFIITVACQNYKNEPAKPLWNLHK